MNQNSTNEVRRDSVLDWLIGSVGRRWPLVLLGAIVLLAALFATQHFASGIASERDVSWEKSFVAWLIIWLLWGLLAPFIFRVARWIRADGSYGRLLLHIPVGAAIAGVHIVLFTICTSWLGPSSTPLFTTVGPLRQTLIENLGFGFIVYTTVVGGYRAFDYYRELRRREVEHLQLKAQLSEARLGVLRGQLQPHFLFNTLHAISAIMEKDVTAARRMMSQMSNLLRFSLDHEPGQEIRLEAELDSLRDFLEIQQTRFADRLRVTWDIDPETLECRVPYLVLQPLAENAVRHGLEPRPGPGLLEVSASLDDGRLKLSVRDDGVGLRNREVEEGVGLANTRARLKSLYGSDAGLHLREREEGGTEATVIVPAGSSVTFEPATS